MLCPKQLQELEVREYSIEEESLQEYWKGCLRPKGKQKEREIKDVLT